MDISIIIPSYNTRDLLTRCLSSVIETLRDTPMHYEVIVVDNASTDGSGAMVMKKFPGVTLIQNKTNVGFGGANNMGIRRAKGEYILLLNSDIVALPGSIVALLACSRAHPKSFVGGKLLNEDMSLQSSSGPMFTLPVVFAMLFLRGDTIGLSRYRLMHDAPVGWVSGACLAGAREAFVRVGLFDEEIFMYMEEIDLLYRAKSYGYTAFFCSNAAFIHTGAASSGSRKTPVVNIYRGILYFYRKHRSIIEQWVVRGLLRLKAYGAIGAGMILGRRDLVAIYEEALHMV